MGHYFINDENLKSEIRKLTYNYELYDFCFSSDNGVFSKDSIDYGSKLLVESFLENTSSESLEILDVGCGYGYIGITLAKVINAKVTMIDINKRALHLSKMNAKENNVEVEILESNAYENINKKYDVIITNPPIRTGKEILKNILIGAKEHLNKDGKLWFVMRKDHGAKSFEKLLGESYEVKVIKKSKGFYIFSLKNIDIHN